MTIPSCSTIILLIGLSIYGIDGREPFKAKNGSIPFVVYFTSRYRGLCVGTLVSRMAVLTAAVCVTNPKSLIHDTRPINVVTGTSYRHPRRGIRVQVTKVLIPNFANVSHRLYLMEMSAAVLLLKRKIPDILTEVPLRALDIDYKNEVELNLQEECLMPGWHFFHKGDTIYSNSKFLLQRNLRVQFLSIVKKNMWCDALDIKFQKALFSEGLNHHYDIDASICARDFFYVVRTNGSRNNHIPDRRAQPCHGMYGAPLVCQGRAVGLLMAPDAQWTNCTGHSNLVHLLSSKYLQNFMSCVSRLFEPDVQMDWSSMKKAVEAVDSDQYDYIPILYDKIASGSSSSEED